MMRSLLQKPPHYGIAIESHRFMAVTEKAPADDAFIRDLAPSGPDGKWPDLADAFDEFRQHVADAPGRISIALMPGLVQVRAIDLPFMRRGEVIRVLQRDAARYFFGARGEQVVAIRHLHRSRTRRTVLAAAAPRWLVELLASQSSDSLRLHQIVPAHLAWAAGARVRSVQHAATWLVVPYGESVELLQLRGASVTQVRRARSEGDEAMVRRITGLLPSAIPSLTCEEPAITIAARRASLAAGLSLIAPSVLARELSRAGRQVRGWLSVAAVLVAISAVLRVADIERELAHVETARATIREEIEDATQVRATVSAIESRLKLLCEIRDNAVRWTDAIVTVAAHLPFSAHLAELSLGGDSLTMAGAATRASDVLEQLREAPGVIALRATEPIRHETNGGQEPTEYFSLMVRLATPGTHARQP